MALSICQASVSQQIVLYLTYAFYLTLTRPRISPIPSPLARPDQLGSCQNLEAEIAGSETVVLTT